RAFHAGVHGKYRAGDRYAAILRINVEMSAGAFGGLNNDVAAAKLNGGVFAAHGDAKLGALIHLHQRAVAQAEHGVRTAGGAGALAFRQLVADFERLPAVEAHAVEDAVERLNAGAHSLRPAEKPGLNEIRADADNDDRCGRGY